jgi:hypothetical protein
MPELQEAGIFLFKKSCKPIAATQGNNIIVQQFTGE